jgi:hypothetical protein
MLLRTINPQSISRHLKLRGSITERQERQNPDENANSIGRETLEGTDVHSLGAAKGGKKPSARLHVKGAHDQLIRKERKLTNPAASSQSTRA